MSDDAQVWLHEYKRARTTIHALATSQPVTESQLENMLAWLRDQMRRYVQACEADGRAWSKDSEHDKADMVGWIRDDLDLDCYRYADTISRAWCHEAGWPS